MAKFNSNRNVRSTKGLSIEAIRAISLEYAAGRPPTRNLDNQSTRQLHAHLSGDEARQRSKALKHNPTPAERRFSEILSTLKIRHKSQCVVFCEYRYFILDFIILSHPKAIVEIDGGSHEGKSGYDEMRTRMILSTPEFRNLKVIRIYNEQVANGTALKIMAERYPKQWAKSTRRA